MDPLQMAAETSGWDIASTIVDSLAALGAIGALLVTSLTYKRHIDDERRTLAAKVRLHPTLTPDGVVSVVIENGGDVPIYDVVTHITIEASGLPDGVGVVRDVPSFPRLEAFEKKIIPLGAKIRDGEQAVRGQVSFRDSSGFPWERSTGGALTRLSEVHFRELTGGDVSLWHRVQHRRLFRR
jgi:hypothetical protein